MNRRIPIVMTVFLGMGILCTGVNRCYGATREQALAAIGAAYDAGSSAYAAWQGMDEAWNAADLAHQDCTTVMHLITGDPELALPQFNYGNTCCTFAGIAEEDGDSDCSVAMTAFEMALQNFTDEDYDGAVIMSNGAGAFFDSADGFYSDADYWYTLAWTAYSLAYHYVYVL